LPWRIEGVFLGGDDDSATAMIPSNDEGRRVMLRRGWVLAALVLLLGGVGQARADIALQSFSGGFDATSGSDQLYGWRFNVLTAVDVTALGVGDTNGDGLAISHDVGIYRVSNQSLVTSATVPAGTVASLDNGFRYVSLGSPALLSPDSYVIVMTMPQSNSDTQSIANSSVTTAPQIAYVNSEFDSGSSLHFPSPAFEGAFAKGMFGPNFQFTGAAATPEPSGLVLTGMGIVTGLGYLGWRRRRQLATA
jgi:hypothetical protein